MEKENERLRIERDAIRREHDVLRLENAQLRDDLRKERQMAETKIAAVHIDTERMVRECRHTQKAAMKAAAAAEAQMKRDASEWEAERRKLLRQLDTCRMWTMQSHTEGRVEHRVMANLGVQLQGQRGGSAA